MKYRAIVVGASAGGVEAFVHIFSKLPALFSLPIIFIQHLHKDQDSTLARFYNDRALLKVEEAEEKERILPGHIYMPRLITTSLLSEMKLFLSLLMKRSITLDLP